MALYHVTFGPAPTNIFVNRSFALEHTILTHVAISVRRDQQQFNAHRVHIGLTPPGDENIQIYMTLISTLLSPSDGASWSGEIRITAETFLVCNTVSSESGMFFLTWATR